MELSIFFQKRERIDREAIDERRRDRGGWELERRRRGERKGRKRRGRKTANSD